MISETTDESSFPGKPKVLIIDDDSSIRRCLTMILKSDHEVFAAEDVDSGLSIFETAAPDLVLIDYMMPGKSGLEGIQLIRKQNPDIPIVLVSGHVDSQLQSQALEAGANLFVEKPFNLADLSATIYRLLSATAGSAR